MTVFDSRILFVRNLITIHATEDNFTDTLSTVIRCPQFTGFKDGKGESMLNGTVTRCAFYTKVKKGRTACSLKWFVFHKDHLLSKCQQALE